MNVLEGFRAMLALRAALERAQSPENMRWCAPGRLDPAAPVAADVRAAGEKLNAWGGSDAMMSAAKALVIEDPVRYFGLRAVLDGLWAGIGEWRRLAA